MKTERFVVTVSAINAFGTKDEIVEIVDPQDLRIERTEGAVSVSASSKYLAANPRTEIGKQIVEYIKAYQRDSGRA